MPVRLGQILALTGMLLAFAAADSPAMSSAPRQQAATQASLKPTPRNLRGLPGTLKLDLSSGLPVINARIGDQTLRLTVDTGASWSLLRPEAAKRLGLALRKSSQLKARDAAGEVRGVNAVHIEKLLLETTGQDGAPGIPIELGDFDLIVLESPVVAAVGADGILGLPVFRRMVARFDLQEETLELGGESLPEDDDGRTLPLQSSAGGLAAIEGRFVAREEQAEADQAEVPVQNLVIDTGFSGYTHLPQKLVTELRGVEAEGVEGTAATALRERRFERVQLEHDLLIGRYRVHDPVASVFPEARDSGDGSIGTGLLRHFVVILDLPKRRIRLEAPLDRLQLEDVRPLKTGSDDVPPR